MDNETTDAYILLKDHLRALLRKLAKEGELIAPVRNSQGDTLFQPVPSLDNVQIDVSGRTIDPPKRFFLPQQETLFNYHWDEAGYRFTEVAEEKRRVIFGLRPCDTTAVLYLDVVFQGHLKDNYYLRRRRDTVLIVLGCHQPQANCFCNATKSGPFLARGYDLQLTDLGSRFFVEIGRIKGEAIVKRWRQFFSPATRQDKREQYERRLEARSGFSRLVHMDTTIRRLQRDAVDEAVWSQMAERCQDCGGCAYICPTCHCFSIIDKADSATDGRRIRIWDACTFGGFARLSGGHSPIAGSDKLKRRFQHKLYYDVEKYGRPGCVGCGRCVGACFGGVDMISFVDLVCGERNGLGRAHG